jgi:hypothetical protein
VEEAVMWVDVAMAVGDLITGIIMITAAWPRQSVG